MKPPTGTLADRRQTEVETQGRTLVPDVIDTVLADMLNDALISFLDLRDAIRVLNGATENRDRTTQPVHCDIRFRTTEKRLILNALGIVDDLSRMLAEARAAKLQPVTHGEVIFKGLPNVQIDAALKAGHISKEYIDGCYELRRVYLDLCSCIYVISERGAAI